MMESVKLGLVIIRVAFPVTTESLGDRDLVEAPQTLAELHLLLGQSWGHNIDLDIFVFLSNDISGTVHRRRCVTKDCSIHNKSMYRPIVILSFHRLSISLDIYDVFDDLIIIIFHASFNIID